ncbi:MAG: FAD-binding protein, partial [Actinobacteria bacterium]|nr:FAD-binding protein [Actinomycetota bacterium]
MGYGIGSMKYGSLLSQVRGVEAVLPTGEIRRLTRDTEPPLDWFAASEGTLGVITEITLKVNPKPPMNSTAMATFETLEDAGRAVSEIMHSGIIP